MLRSIITNHRQSAFRIMGINIGWQHHEQLASQGTSVSDSDTSIKPRKNPTVHMPFLCVMDTVRRVYAWKINGYDRVNVNIRVAKLVLPRFKRWMEEGSRKRRLSFTRLQHEAARKPFQVCQKEGFAVKEQFVLFWGSNQWSAPFRRLGFQKSFLYSLLSRYFFFQCNNM